eukprot:371411-Prorocentrum_minimum.AAC.1
MTTPTRIVVRASELDDADFRRSEKVGSHDRSYVRAAHLATPPGEPRVLGRAPLRMIPPSPLQRRGLGRRLGRGFGRGPVRGKWGGARRGRGLPLDAPP